MRPWAQSPLQACSGGSAVRTQHGLEGTVTSRELLRPPVLASGTVLLPGTCGPVSGGPRRRKSSTANMAVSTEFRSGLSLLPSAGASTRGSGRAAGVPSRRPAAGRQRRRSLKARGFLFVGFVPFGRVRGAV